MEFCLNIIPAEDSNRAAIDITGANVSDLFNLKVKLTGQTGGNATENVEIMVPLKDQSSFAEFLKYMIQL